jgi:hypothetical protein
MNEILKKLADDCRTLYRDGSGEYVEQFDEEKFAELIIQESTRIIDECRHDPFPFDEDYVILLLKTHFGVE